MTKPKRRSKGLTAREVRRFSKWLTDDQQFIRLWLSRRDYRTVRVFRHNVRVEKLAEASRRLKP